MQSFLPHEHSTKCHFNRPGKTKRREVNGMLALFCYILTSGLLFDDSSHFVHVIDTHYVWAACAATWAELFKAGLR